MARLYTREDINEILQDLKIDPIGGNVTTKEAALILTERAKREFGVDHPYPESAVRRRDQRGHLTPVPKETGWANLYRVEDIFRLSLYPKRGAKPKETVREH